MADAMMLRLPRWEEGASDGPGLVAYEVLRAPFAYGLLLGYGKKTLSRADQGVYGDWVQSVYPTWRAYARRVLIDAGAPVSATPSDPLDLTVFSVWARSWVGRVFTTVRWRGIPWPDADPKDGPRGFDADPTWVQVTSSLAHDLLFIVADEAVRVEPSLDWSSDVSLRQCDRLLGSARLGRPLPSMSIADIAVNPFAGRPEHWDSVTQNSLRELLETMLTATPTHGDAPRGAGAEVAPRPTRRQRSPRGDLPRGAAFLPEDGPCTFGPIRLPAGRRLEGVAGAVDTPSVWATDDPVDRPGLISDAPRAPAGDGSLVPVVLDGLEHPADRSWDTAEIGSPVDDDIAGLDAVDVFRERWLNYVPVGSIDPADGDWLSRRSAGLFAEFLTGEEDDEETAFFLRRVAPWSVRFPGLARPESTPICDNERTRALTEAGPGRIALVVATSSALIPWTLGWQGASNHFLGEPHGPAKLAVMMRSWEERFGAHLFRIGLATMEMIVERPPSSDRAALAVAAEHFSFAGPDGFQAYDSVDSISSLAAMIIASPTWRFWWD